MYHSQTHYRYYTVIALRQPLITCKYAYRGIRFFNRVHDAFIYQRTQTLYQNQLICDNRSQYVTTCDHFQFLHLHYLLVLLQFTFCAGATSKQQKTKERPVTWTFFEILKHGFHILFMSDSFNYSVSFQCNNCNCKVFFDTFFLHIFASSVMQSDK